MRIEYRIVCGHHGRTAHADHVFDVPSHDAAVAFAAYLDERSASEARPWRVEARIVGSWARPDVVEALAVEIAALSGPRRDGGPAPPIADPPDVSPPSRTPETATHEA